MRFDFLIIALAALVPLFVGFIWYNPKVLGNAWMKSAGLSEEQLKGANMPLIFGFSYLFAFMLAMFLNNIVIHQFGFMQILAGDPALSEVGSESYNLLQEWLGKYGTNFRTFKHGALHGTITGILFVLPILGTSALFERKGFKYIAIHTGYWALTLAIMGGIVCQFSNAY